MFSFCTSILYTETKDSKRFLKESLIFHTEPTWFFGEKQLQMVPRGVCSMWNQIDSFWTISATFGTTLVNSVLHDTISRWPQHRLWYKRLLVQNHLLTIGSKLNHFVIYQTVQRSYCNQREIFLIFRNWFKVHFKCSFECPFKERNILNWAWFSKHYLVPHGIWSSQGVCAKG